MIEPGLNQASSAPLSERVDRTGETLLREEHG